MQDHNTFVAELTSWLQEVITTDKPSQPMAAFRFGLTESEEGYVFYLAGSLVYDEADDEWAAELPVFIAEKELLISSEEESEWYWQLLEVIYCLGRVLRTKQVQQSYLSNTPVYTGFVDGDLFRII
ncbi:MAG: hypothetical protein ACRYFK_18685 [Janthinobacterium lividum]